MCASALCRSGHSVVAFCTGWRIGEVREIGSSAPAMCWVRRVSRSAMVDSEEVARCYFVM